MKRIFFPFLLLLSQSLTSYAAISLPDKTEATPAPAHTDVKTALKEFKTLSKKERKGRIREAKKILHDYKKEKKSGKTDSDDKMVLLVILAILLPPLAVYLKEDEITTKFWISLILTLLFWIPGVVYAMLVIFDVV